MFVRPAIALIIINTFEVCEKTLDINMIYNWRGVASGTGIYEIII